MKTSFITMETRTLKRESLLLRITLVLFLLPLTSCAMIDFSVPERSLAFTSFGGAARAASGSAYAYKDRANELANEGLVTQGPAMAATVGAAASAIFRGSLREIQAFGLAAVSFVGADQYFSPRARSKIYLAASAQMSCLARIAYKTSNLIYYIGTDGHLHLNRSFRYARKLAYSSTITEAQRSALGVVADLPNTGVVLLGSAMDSVDRVALAAGLGASVYNTAQLQTDLTQDIKQSEVIREAANAGATKAASDPAVQKPEHDDAQEPVSPTQENQPSQDQNKNAPQQSETVPVASIFDPPANLEAVRHIIDWAANFPTQVRACTGPISPTT